MLEADYEAQVRLVDANKAAMQSLIAIKENLYKLARDEGCSEAYSQSINDQRDFMTASSYIIFLASLLSSTVGVHLLLMALPKK